MRIQALEYLGGRGEIEDHASSLVGWCIPARRLFVGRERPTYIIEGTLTSFLKWTT